MKRIFEVHAITKNIFSDSGLDDKMALLIETLIIDGRYIEAIKEYRYWTRSGLVEAKTAIDKALQILRS
jgi:ribosomal protein L7/L12